MLDEVFVHRFTHHHLFIELDQELLGLLSTHFVDLGLKGAEAKLLLQGEP